MQSLTGKRILVVATGAVANGERVETATVNALQAAGAEVTLGTYELTAPGTPSSPMPKKSAAQLVDDVTRSEFDAVLIYDPSTQYAAVVDNIVGLAGDVGEETPIIVKEGLPVHTSINPLVKAGVTYLHGNGDYTLGPGGVRMITDWDAYRDVSPEAIAGSIAQAIADRGKSGFSHEL